MIAEDASGTALLLEEVERVHGEGAAAVAALRGVTLHVERGDFVALMGPSGCGKSTLLHVAGGMDRPTAGRVAVDGIDLADLREEELAALRRRKIGFVFQFFNLLPTLTVRENVALPLLLDGVATRSAAAAAERLLERVGLLAKAERFPAELSGGEMQRTAVARAVAGGPRLVLADEPTGSLDSAAGAAVMGLLGELNRELGITVIIATHSEEVARAARRKVLLRDGRIERIAGG